MGDVEVVGLRTCDGTPIGERGAHIAVTPCEKVEVLADTDDLGGGIEVASKVLDHHRPETYGAFLFTDIRPARMANEPVLPAKHPDLHLVRIEQIDRAPSDLR